jgi:hypothetical protein
MECSQKFTKYWYWSPVVSNGFGCYIDVAANTVKPTYCWITFYSECGFCTTDKRAVYKSGLTSIPPNSPYHLEGLTLGLASTNPNQVLGDCN